MQYLCNLGDLETKDEAQEFKLGEGKSLLVFLRKGEVSAYFNSCPHLGLPLNFLPNRFFNQDKSLLQCSNHMALFKPDSGLCVAGPCQGASLEKAEIKIEGKQIFLIHD